MLTTKSTLLASGLAAMVIASPISVRADDNAMAEQFAADRLAAFGRGDAVAILAQYADDATVITPTAVLQGKDQIKGMIDGIVAEFAQPGVTFELISKHAIGPIVTFSWTAQTGANVYDLGSETYVLEDGLAVYQTFAAKVTPR